MAYRYPEREAAWRKANPEKVRAAQRAWYEKNKQRVIDAAAAIARENPEKEAQRLAEYRRNNREKCRERVARSKKANKEAVAAYNLQWQRDNREKMAEFARKWRSENPHKVNVAVARRRAMKLQATPSWANEELILEFYELAHKKTCETGVRHHADHIVPLQSKLVCGLHCQENFQVITFYENISKGNRVWPDMP